MQDPEVSIKDANVEGYRDVGVGNDVHEPAKAKDAAKEMTVVPARTWTMLHLCRTRK